MIRTTIFLIAATCALLASPGSCTSPKSSPFWGGDASTSSEPVAQTQEISLSSLFYNFTLGLAVPSSGIDSINGGLEHLNLAQPSFARAWDYYTSSDPAKTNHQATLNFTYGLELSGRMITHFLDAYVSASSSLTTFQNRFTNFQHLLLSLNQTYATYLFNVTASSLSIMVNYQYSLWNTISRQIGKLLRISLLTPAVSYTAPTTTTAFLPQFPKLEDPIHLLQESKEESKARRAEYESRINSNSFISITGYSTDYYYYPVERASFTETDSQNFYKHFLFYAGLLVDTPYLINCPAAYSTFVTPFFSALSTILTYTSSSSLISGLYRMADSFAYVYTAYVSCYEGGNLQYQNLNGIQGNIGTNYLYFVDNAMNRRVEIGNKLTAYYPCVRMGDWECVARVSGQIINLIFIAF